RHHAAGRCADVETEAGNRAGITFRVPVAGAEQTIEPSPGGDERANSGTRPANEPSGIHLPLRLGRGRLDAEPAEDQKRRTNPGSQHRLDATLDVTPNTSGRRLHASEGRAHPTDICADARPGAAPIGETRREPSIFGIKPRAERF